MRRDMTLVREVLLKVEAINIPPGAKMVVSARQELDDDETSIAVEGYTPDDMDRHLRLLVDAGFLSGKAANDGVITEGLTWSGCEFLDTVRSPEVWRRTETAVSKVGSVGVSVLAKIAEGVAKGLVKETLGFDLG